MEPTGRRAGLPDIANSPDAPMSTALAASLDDLARQLLEAAEAADVSIIVAESCTAGLLSQVLSDAPGSAERFHGAFITYTKQQKTEALGVSPWLLASEGAVNCEVARAMAEGALDHSPAQLAVAITGVAGPDPDEDGNPVGKVCIATARRGDASIAVERRYSTSGREEIRQRAAIDALTALLDRLGGRRGC
jgi:nicotinamide-nucleotide amidase